MTDKHYSIEIKNSEGDTVRSNTIFQEEIKSVGGIGNMVESLNHFLKDNESIQVGVFYR